MILVDSLRWYEARGRPDRRGRERWAHLVSDESLEEMHEFAERLGLRRSWSQGDHYDVRPRQHARALADGAVLVTTRELAMRRVRAPRRRKVRP